MKKDELIAFIVECEAWKKRFRDYIVQSRERSLVVMKLDEARLWASEILALEDQSFEMP
jgi:hypothetical protein